MTLDGSQLGLGSLGQTTTTTNPNSTLLWVAGFVGAFILGYVLFDEPEEEHEGHRRGEEEEEEEFL